MPDSDVASVIDTPFDAALSERYLVYALSTITARYVAFTCEVNAFSAPPVLLRKGARHATASFQTNRCS